MTNVHIMLMKDSPALVFVRSSSLVGPAETCHSTQQRNSKGSGQYGDSILEVQL